MKRTLCVVGVSLLLLASTIPGAFGHDTTQRMPDGTPALLFRNDLTAAWSNSVERVRTTDWNPTDLTTQYVTSLSAAYVHVVDNDYGPTGWSGAETCQTSPNNDGVCLLTRVMINQYERYIPGGTWTATKRDSLMCEELGHALGMDHNDVNGCMSQDWSDDFYSDHDIMHINNWY